MIELNEKAYELWDREMSNVLRLRRPKT